MPTYQVDVMRCLARSYTVDADNEDEAREIAREFSHAESSSEYETQIDAVREVVA